MEEWVGKAWHKLITRSASREYPQARVHLDEMRKTLGIVLRALGGDAGLQIRQSSEIASGASPQCVAADCWNWFENQRSVAGC